jgi:hypothetical protein
MARRLQAVLAGIWMAGAACAPGQDGGFFLEKPVTEQPSPEVAASAVAAVRQLGAEVVQGRYKVAVDRMYPQWKDRTARQLGGMDKLEAKMTEASREMTRQGVSMVSFQPAGESQVFEVWPGKKRQTANGKTGEIFVYTKWLVIIPTVTRFNIIRDHQNQVIESRGFQVAISDKGTNDWTFIDGASLTVRELRSLFLTLPEDFKLPEIERRAVPPGERR